MGIFDRLCEFRLSFDVCPSQNRRNCCTATKWRDGPEAEVGNLKGVMAVVVMAVANFSPR